MRSIKDMSLDELARHAITITGVDWGTLLGAWTPTGRVCGVRIGGVTEILTINADWMDIADVELNLNDGATVGCFLAMIRGRFGENTWTVYTPRGWQVMTDEGHRTNCIVRASEGMPSEIHALIAAMEVGR